MIRIRILMGLMVLLLAGLSSRADEDGFRVFTSVDDRMIEARIVEYDANRGRLKIERRGKGVMWVNPEVFCTADQDYIKKWVAASAFLRDRVFQVKAEKDRISKAGSRTKQREVETWKYDVVLKNRSKEPLKNVGADYKYFILIKGVAGNADTLRVETGNLTIGSIKPNETKTVSTSKVELETLYRTQRETSYDSTGGTSYETSIVKTSEERLIGIWIRVYGPPLDGERMTRNITFPDNLAEKYSWGEKGNAKPKLKIRQR